ncbi:hypothetical protein EYZ11_003381 [Aspergillus tanneri]|uniref:Presequence translocated-associated motor subunit PAM17 n=1 Tax=Aspergillus tanneri TaxID=1220188 RepID=A0A4S3JQJ3_9EURO|nr:hypothetical protein EYZ11_003381 [Aspergillus tanneri]
MHITSLSAPARTTVLGCRFSSTTLGPYSQARTASASASPIHALRSQITTLKTSTRPQIASAVSITCRAASLRANSTASTASTASRSEAAKLDWNSFFKLRASRRRYTLASSVLSSLATTTIGVQVLSGQDLEHLGAQVMGLDPFVVLGMATAACGAAGWLVGPFLGNAVWGLVYRRYKPAVTIKEKEFFDRIKRFRVDPSSNSIANPVPDYYGEKIGSVQGYRQWLKDQRAYNRKRRSFIL